MWTIIQLGLAILYFAHIPALATVPAFLFFIPLIIAGIVLGFVAVMFLFALIVAVAAGRPKPKFRVFRSR